MPELELILQKHKLRKTAFRMELLFLFFESGSSLTVEEVKSRVKSTNDKVTIYRALDAFEKNGIIHKVPDKSNLTRYAVCYSECSSKEHVHNHAHFICNRCNQTFCIDDIEIPNIKTANGFKISTANLTLEGYCPNCQKE